MNCISPTISDSTRSSPTSYETTSDRRSYVSLEKQEDTILNRSADKRRGHSSSCVSPGSSGGSPFRPTQLHQSHNNKGETTRQVTPPPNNNNSSMSKSRHSSPGKDSFDDEIATPSTTERSSVLIISPSLSSSRSSRAPTPTVNNTSATRGLSFASSTPPDQSSLMNTMNLLSSESSSGDDSESEPELGQRELAAIRPSPRNKNSSIARDRQPLQRRPSPQLRQFPYDRQTNHNNNSEDIPKYYHPAYWNQRLARKEIYSRRYRPNQAEKEELTQMEDFLGLPEARKSRKNVIVQQWRKLNPSTTQAASQNVPMSIVLKRGPVCWGSYDDCELILLTRGFVIARKVFHYSPKFQMGESWENVKQVVSTGLTSFTIGCNDKLLDFTCPTVLEQQAWMHALRIVVVQSYSHQASLLDMDEEANDQFQEGWQYKVVQSPWFTEAVTGQVEIEPEMLDSMDNSKINSLDSYNQFAPLHYAVRGHNIDAMSFLLQAGADPNLADGMGRTALQYAEEEKLPKSSVELLNSYGGRGADASNQSCITPVKNTSRRCRCVAMSILLLLLLATGVTTFLIWFLGKDDSNSTSALSASQSSAAQDSEDGSSNDATGDSASSPPPFLVVGVNPIPATNLTTETSNPSLETGRTPAPSNTDDAEPAMDEVFTDSLGDLVTNLTDTLLTGTTDAPLVATTKPTAQPTPQPSISPMSLSPTDPPYEALEFLPLTTDTPTFSITQRETARPSAAPTKQLTTPPTSPPTETDAPTGIPTRLRTASPAPAAPTRAPVDGPTNSPTFASIKESDLLPEDVMLFEFLVGHSLDGGATLRNPKSPQYRAFRWLSGNMDLTLYSDERKVQRYALAVLFYSTEGEQWINSNYWLSDEDECTFWFSRISEVATNAVCNSDKQIITLDLDYNNLKGTVPKEVGLLTHLRRMELYGGPEGFITGIIPTELGLLQDLQSLNLRGNELTDQIPSELGGCKALSNLNLSQNRLFGSIPTTLGMLRQLQSIAMETNRLEGPLPTQLGQISSLRSMTLGTNALTGMISSEVGLLNELRGLDLEGNQMYSTIPSHMGLLANLTLFHMTVGGLYGTIPPEVGLMTGLQSLQLRGNALEGTIPSTIGQLSNLGTLDLSYNSMTGQIPSELGQASRLRSLLLNSNRLQSTIASELAGLSRLNTLRIELNDLTGEVPIEVCDVFFNTYPVFYADCMEVYCPCCSYCCSETGCLCTYAGTMNEFLC